MSKQDYADKIVELLEGIVNRTNEIHRDPDSEQCLELDLVMEDVRLLYRYYVMMRKACEAGHQPVAATPAMPAAPAREVPSFFTDAPQPEENPDKAPEPLSQASPDSAPPANPDPAPPADAEPPPGALSDHEPGQGQEPLPEPDHQPEPDIQPEPVPKKEEDRVPRPPASTAPEHNAGNGKTVIDLFSETQTRSV